MVITHKLDYIKNSDLIYAMKDGKIIEKGTHKELLEMNGYYSKLIKQYYVKNKINLLGNEKNDSNDNIIITEERNKNIITNEIDNISEDIEENEILEINENNQLNEIEENKNIKIDKKKLWKLLSSHKCDLFIGTFSGLLYGSVAPFVGIIIGMAIDILSSKDNEKIQSEGFIISLSFILFGIFGGLSIFLKFWKLPTIGSVISYKMKKKIIKKYLKLHMGYFDLSSNSPGALLTKLAIDTSQLDSLILNIVGGFMTAISTYVISIILGMQYDWKITLILSLFVPISVYGVMKKDEYEKKGTEFNKKSKIKAGSFLSECVNNTKTIFSFNFQNKAKEIFLNILNSETKDYLQKSIIQGIWIGIGLGFYSLSYAIVFMLAIIFIKNKTLTFKNLCCAITNIVNSCDGLTDILRNIGDTQKAKLSFISVFNILDTKSRISAFESDNIGKKSAKDIIGKIEFKNVCFSYPTKPDQLVLKNISFTINPGQKIGLVGHSGSGKSSIIQLIERFYDVNSGEILIDDINIREYNLYELRKNIGLVSQEPIIFKRNVYENIIYGNLDATNEQVLEAAEKANINKYINDNNNENPLSGGEKQRVAIARAFLKDPKIILLDEATSALDKSTEKEIQENLNELQKGKTCINVAHRLNTIMKSDIILVLDSGRLIEKGTHDELLKLKGKYYNLYKYSDIQN